MTSRSRRFMLACLRRGDFSYLINWGCGFSAYAADSSPSDLKLIQNQINKIKSDKSAERNPG